ncbi:MarR family winged helix-turn-helix transcriptional regulator [Leifsonia sp. 2MCAF36]|uniref:MarR family winged helix-turn-helix transcriptional regulator n=1 Tax=Leifsonia sp. 2MCAF36 TaxID=3232988 RepID=UPI003F99A96B
MTNLRELFDDLVRTKALIWSGIDRGLADGGLIGLGPLSMLNAIHSRGRCRVQDLAVEAIITTGGASQAVDRLVRMGLCQRIDNPDDRRSSLVELTGDGVRAMSAANVAYDELLETYFAPIPTGERVALGSALGLLRARATP